jgi:DNA excision repair protein ERCC-4
MRIMDLPAEPKPERITAVIDSREQMPLDVSPLKSTVGTLTTGDYSVQGLESIISIERKSLPDFLSCVGRERERFEREIQRLLAYQTRCLVVEATWLDLESGDWRSKVTPQAAVGSVLGWIGAGLPVALVGDHERAGRFVSRLLFISARRRWREARSLVIGTTGDSP